ncbi:MAG TPA: nitrilase-related carbon-nitrogen hydrolase [Candidatus Eisenbacteria bacterium]
MRVGFVQYEPVFGEVAANLAAIETAVEAAGRADLMVLPELATTGYNFATVEEAEALSEPVPGPSTERLAALARRLETWLVVGIAEAAGGKRYNSSVLIGPDGSVGTYRKLHLYDREKLFFVPGDLGLPVFRLPVPGDPVIGMMICFDWRFPEAARGLALAGADIIAHPSNLVLTLCQAAMITRCLENRVFAVTANRTGVEDRGGVRIGFTGGSQIVDPNGVVLAAADPANSGSAVVTIDLAEARNKSINSRNDLWGDRRVGEYG